MCYFVASKARPTRFYKTTRTMTITTTTTMTTMASVPCGREESRQALSRNEMLMALTSVDENKMLKSHACAAGHFKDSGEGRKEEAFGFNNTKLLKKGSESVIIMLRRVLLQYKAHDMVAKVCISNICEVYQKHKFMMWYILTYACGKQCTCYQQVVHQDQVWSHS